MQSGTLFCFQFSDDSSKSSLNIEQTVAGFAANHHSSESNHWLFASSVQAVLALTCSPARDITACYRKAAYEASLPSTHHAPVHSWL